MPQYACVKISGGKAVVCAADTDLPFGFLQDSVGADAPHCNVATSGPTKAIASGIIGFGVEFCADADGKIKAAAAGDLVAGMTEQAATADGHIINVLHYKTSVVKA